MGANLNLRCVLILPLSVFKELGEENWEDIEKIILFGTQTKTIIKHVI